MNFIMIVDAGLGFEPRIPGNEPDVLPLHYPAMMWEYLLHIPTVINS